MKYILLIIPVFFFMHSGFGQKPDTIIVKMKVNANPMLPGTTWKNAYYKFVYNKVVVREGEIKNNLPEGIWKYNTINGKPDLVIEQHTQNNVPLYRGIYEEYDPDGHLKLKGQYDFCVNDSIRCINCYEYDIIQRKEIPVAWVTFQKEYTLRTGIWKEYYSNGKIKSEGEYASTVAYDHQQFSGKQKKRNNLWVVYYNEALFPFKDWKYYNEDGKLIKIVTYDEVGAILNTISY